MAKVTSPLFGNWREAFGNSIVFQGSHLNNIIVRKKVVHALDPTSAHYAPRAHKWAFAVHHYLTDNALNESLIDSVARYALSPEAPTDLSADSISLNAANPSQYDIHLSWTAPTTKYNNHTLANLLGYHVNFSADGIHWQRLTTTPQSATTYTDTRTDGTYYYSVQAIDDQDNISSETVAIEVMTILSHQKYNAKEYNLFTYALTNPADEPQTYNSKAYSTFRYD